MSVIKQMLSMHQVGAASLKINGAIPVSNAGKSHEEQK